MVPRVENAYNSTSVILTPGAIYQSVQKLR